MKAPKLTKNDFEIGAQYKDHFNNVVTVTRFVDDPKLKPSAAIPVGKRFEQFYNFDQLTKI